MFMRITNLLSGIVALLMLSTRMYELGTMFLLFAIFNNVAHFVEKYIEYKEREWLNQPVDCKMEYEIHLTKEEDNEN